MTRRRVRLSKARPTRLDFDPMREVEYDYTFWIVQVVEQATLEPSTFCSSILYTQERISLLYLITQNTFFSSIKT